jgi:TRAP-type uncharacterized transport system fused permease subunit
MEGYFLRTALWFERLILLAAALLLIDPNVMTDLIGLGLLGGVLLSQKLRSAEQPKPAE